MQPMPQMGPMPTGQMQPMRLPQMPQGMAGMGGPAAGGAMGMGPGAMAGMGGGAPGGAMGMNRPMQLPQMPQAMAGMGGAPGGGAMGMGRPMQGNPMMLAQQLRADARGPGPGAVNL